MKYVHVKYFSFKVNAGECFGLIGTNGAGKSSIFKILSGECKSFTGTVDFIEDFASKAGNISYCPQINALDMLLTVEEVINFYGKLRNVKD